jgi:hypothetical protein
MTKELNFQPFESFSLSGQQEESDFVQDEYDEMEDINLYNEGLLVTGDIYQAQIYKEVISLGMPFEIKDNDEGYGEVILLDIE